MDEPAARQAVLAQAIESVDTEGKLLGPAERDQVDRQARQDALRRGDGRSPISEGEFVHLRAQRVLAEVAVREPAVSALQEPGGWRPWLEWGVPLAAMVVGVLTDVIGNPHRLDLVSLPLLGIVVWNVVVYLLLVVRLVLPRSRQSPWVARIGRWRDGGWAWARRKPSLRTQVAAQFHLQWLRVSQPLHTQRCLRVLHLSAAAWALGVIFSLLVRGLVVEYKVGWESTFLGPGQVYDILRVLRWPALLVLPFEPFTVLDVANLRFSDGGGVAGGAPWVWMYVSLLLVVVIVPRVLLATVAAWRETRLARAVPLDLSDPYHRRIVSLLDSTRVQLGLLTHRPEDRDRILGLLAPDKDALPIVASTDLGDALRIDDVPLQEPLAAAANPGGVSWLRKLQQALTGDPLTDRPDALAQARADCDVIVHVSGGAGDAQAARSLLHWLGKPVLFLRLPAGEAADGWAQTPSRSLEVAQLERSWICERAWWRAVGALLPEGKSHGFERVMRVWDDRQRARLRQSMSAIAEHLLQSARQAQEVHGSALTVKNLLPGERQAQSDARQVAMDAIAQRVRDSEGAMVARLRKLHGLDAAPSGPDPHGIEHRFSVQQSVHAPQAGMAGAATGAAMGASVDLLAGGLTLGAAAALGALVGGSGAWIAAAWRNRTAPGGGTLVQLSDQMLLALAESALLRYLLVVHSRAGVVAPDVAWGREIAQGLEGDHDLLAGFWSAARTQPNAERIAQPLAHELEQVVERIFKKIYPE